MKTYKSKITQKIGNVFTMICSNIIVFIVVLLIFQSMLIVVTAISLIALYFIFIGGHYQIEVDDQELKIYKGFKLNRIVNHKDVEYTYSIDTVNGDGTC